MSLIGLSAGIERVLFGPQTTTLTISIEQLVKATNKQQYDIEVLPASLGIPFRILEKSDISFPPDDYQRLLNGEHLIAKDQNNLTTIYAALNNGKILEVSLLNDKDSDKNLLSYSIIFFILLGVAIAIWIWPLWRDLSTLQKTTQIVSSTGRITPNNIGKRSLIYPIARAFNQMQRKITELVNNQRELTGAVAHEFRTPLARLKFAFAVDEQSSSDEIQKDIQELEKLVQEMLDYTSSEVTEPELNLAEIPVKALCQSVFKRLPTERFEKIKVTIEGRDLHVLADAHYLERAISNLLLNATRYATSALRISIEDEESYICIHIEDDGKGVAKNIRNKIFTPFYRPDKSRDRYQGGAGLGLAIVKRIAEWHQGKCEVSESLLGGAKFSLKLRKPKGNFGSL
jgi:two-component system OmpR family sensor kinase